MLVECAPRLWCGLEEETNIKDIHGRFIYSMMVSSLWPSVPYAVPSRLTGISFGLMTAMQNAGLATVPLIVGAILDANTPKAVHTFAPNATIHNMTTTMTFAPNGTIPNGTTHGPVPTVFRALLSVGLDATTGSNGNPLPTMHGFKIILLLFMGFGAVSSLFALLLWTIDASRTGVLNASPARRAEMKKEALAQEGAIQTKTV